MDLQVDDSDELLIKSNKRAASDMLEDAIHQFDNIIDSTTNPKELDGECNGMECQNLMVNDLKNGLEGVALLMEDLRNAIEATVDAEVEDENERRAFNEALIDFLSPETLLFYRNLLKSQVQDDRSHESLSPLQCENNSLALQVSVLNDQVELQTEKLKELEFLLQETTDRLNGADARLQEEVEAKTNLETEKLQLLNDVSNFKISLAQQQRQSENSIADVQRQLDLQTNHYKLVTESLKNEIAEKEKFVEELQQRLTNINSNYVKNLTTPDEGIVSDHVIKESHLMQLQMPAPFATSTPVSTDQEANNIKQCDLLQGKTIDQDRSPKSRTKDYVLQSSENPSDSSPKNSLHPVDKMASLSSPPTSVKSTPPSSRAAKSSSTPNLLMTESQSKLPINPTSNEPSNAHQFPFQIRKKHGFRKFFTSFKLRRTRSTSIKSEDDDEIGENFKRGGARSTAGPKLQFNLHGQKNELKYEDSTPETESAKNVPFQHWDTERVCQWFVSIGLSSYVDPCRKWIKGGDTLLRATNSEIEKELGLKNSLHKKKLMIHLQSLAGGDDEDMIGFANMDSVWVARWLDDIGLPQYKDSFHEACIDGCTLHHMTISDAQKLKITNLFHLISLRRGLEKLRECRFDPGRLQRRPVSDEGEIDDVSLWTNHRVMEWLRSVDLAEYAPNLRGSGVHGALMVSEPLFTSETLASLLIIPIGKSLLRRHLATKLDELLPDESVRMKRRKMKEPGYHPLNTAVKYKVGRRSFGGFRRFRTGASGASTLEFNSNEYVSPISSSKTMTEHRNALEMKMQMIDTNKDEVEPSELNENTTREINAFSNEINTLTNKWIEN